MPVDFDTIIRGGTVVDGTRLPRFRADVGIRNGRVAKIGRIPATATCLQELDATGCFVAPGFFDVHCHYDAQIHWDPYCSISSWHGVTSVILGNCGIGFAPAKPQDRDRLMRMMTRTEQVPYESMKAGMDWTWESFPEWLENLARIPKGVNCISFVPLSPLLVYVMGVEASKTRPTTPAELKEMRRLLNEAMDAGACGFSVQRSGENSGQRDFDGTPLPTDLMAFEDILALAEVLRERDEGFIQITQNPNSDNWLNSRQEVLDFVERLAAVAQRPVIHNVIQARDEAPELHIMDIEWLDRVNEKGLRVIGQGVNNRPWMDFSLDRWNLYDASPAWRAATLGSIEERKRLMTDPDHRAQMRAEREMLFRLGPDTTPENCTVIDVAGVAEFQSHLGRKVGDIAAEEGKDPTDVMLDLSVASDLKVKFRTGSLTSADPEKVGRLMNNLHVVAGTSDGGAHTQSYTGGSYPTELLSWLVRDEKKLSVEEAHYHLSYLPAQCAGFSDRGLLREGAPADIVVYDLQKLRRVPEWSYEIAHDLPAGQWRLVQHAEGYRWTLVNGVVTYANGVCTGATPGVLLRNERA
jgi:N-acyl-D-aspartate/D-glutamate deacylase